MDPRINLGKAAPELYKTVMNLDRQASEYATSIGGLLEGFVHLLRLRASQINKCAYCVRLHSRDASKSGESNDRISVLPAWRETQYFNEKERACLSLCEAITLISEGQVADAVYAEAAAVLTPEEIGAVEWITVVINTWNRIAIPSRYPVGE